MEKIETVEKVISSRTLGDLNLSLGRLTKMLDYEKVHSCSKVKRFESLNPIEEPSEIVLVETCMHYSKPHTDKKEGILYKTYSAGYIPLGRVSAMLPFLQILDNSHRIWGYGSRWENSNPDGEIYYMD